VALRDHVIYPDNKKKSDKASIEKKHRFVRNKIFDDELSTYYSKQMSKDPLDAFFAS
jgi:hypothetical protein